jgi:hypothetical protein
VTGVSRRQADNPQLSRAELLRQSMLAVLEGSERKNETGETIYTHAQPLFWAPYTIMGTEVEAARGEPRLTRLAAPTPMNERTLPLIARSM